MRDADLVKRILVLTANPKGSSRLRLDAEIRDIEAGLLRSRNRDQFVLVSMWAVRPRDIQRAMLDVEPQIVHFSGHGFKDKGLAFEDDVGRPKLIDGQALAQLFDLFSDKLECVVLNGCYSEAQARSIAQHIKSVIGMASAIGDYAAIEFSVGFYDALGAGYSVDFAYRLGCSALALAGIPEHLTPVLIQKGVQKEEHPSITTSQVESKSQIPSQSVDAKKSNFEPDNKLSDRKKYRLIQERESLQNQFNTIQVKLENLRNALSVEIDPATKLKLEFQIKGAKTDSNQIDQQLDDIEKRLDLDQ